MTEDRHIHITVPDSAEAIRLDRYLADREDVDLTRSRIQRLIVEGMITVNGVPVAKSYDVAVGDEIVMQIPPPPPRGVVAEDIPLDIVYEDEHLAVVNKPVGMVTHPAVWNRTGTLVNAIMHRFDKLAAGSAGDRPGIVHRLDKNTSGLLIVAKTDAVYGKLQKALQAHEVHRRYLALVCGHMPEPEGLIDLPIGRSPRNRKKMMVEGSHAREARTRYKLKNRYRSYDLLDVALETGRTHQIRVHCTYVGHPVFGDPDYGGREKLLKGMFGPERPLATRMLAMMPRQALHARQLEFVHPQTAETVVVEAPPPPDFAALLKILDEEG